MNKIIVLTSCLVILIVLIVCFVTLYGSDDINNNKDLETLKLIHVIFRHGDRSNDKFTIYPNDPNKNYSYSPIGYGRLTNNGKMKVYNIGRTLFNKYEAFIGDSNPEDIVNARSSASPRAIVSMQLLLAGLFAPKAHQIWNQNLYWQPIPFTYVQKSHDKILQGYNCPNYQKLYHEYRDSLENQIIIKNYTKIFEYLSTHTGWNIKYFEDAAFLNAALQVEEEWGLKLPNWTNTVWPEPIKSAQHQYYYEMTGNNLLMKYTIGFLLKEIITDSKTKFNDQIINVKKIFLYSAHDYNIGFFLRALDLLDRPRNPKYGSYIVVELHEINNIFGYKILYENYNYDKPEVLNIPNCGTFCPLDQFEKIVYEYIPDDNLLCGTETQCQFS